MKKQRIYIPGDEWLYFRIYTGYNTADMLIIKVLYTIAEKLIGEGSVSSWFFIRYADPDHHLRFRMKLLAPGSNREIISLVQNELKPYVEQQLVWKVELSTYYPEEERYGHDIMEYSERLFRADSEAFVKFMQAVTRHGDMHSRWLFALASANQFLNDFKLDLNDRKELLLNLNRSFGKEFSKDKHLARQISEKYRRHRERIQNILEMENDREEDKMLIKILRERSIMSEDDIQAILQIYEMKLVMVPVNDLLASLIHMSMNRIFQNNNRLHEMVLYDFLFRYYKSKIARQRVT